MLDEYYCEFQVYDNDPDHPADCLCCVRITAVDEGTARSIAKGRLAAVIEAYGDEGITENDIYVYVKSWSAWGNQLDKTWDTLCKFEANQEDEDL